jgi:hypothetical protein
LKAIRGIVTIKTSPGKDTAYQQESTGQRNAGFVFMLTHRFGGNNDGELSCSFRKKLPNIIQSANGAVTIPG